MPVAQLSGLIRRLINLFRTRGVCGSLPQNLR